MFSLRTAVQKPNIRLSYQASNVNLAFTSGLAFQKGRLENDWDPLGDIL